MRKLLKSILAALARALRRLLGLPEPVITEEYEDVPDAALEAEAEEDDSRTWWMGDLPKRIRAAAEARLAGKPWRAELGRDEILSIRAWLGGLEPGELRTLVELSDREIRRHVSNEATVSGLTAYVRPGMPEGWTELEPSRDPDEPYAPPATPFNLWCEGGSGDGQKAKPSSNEAPRTVEELREVTAAMYAA